jgi:hypothetical protein
MKKSNLVDLTNDNKLNEAIQYARSIGDQSLIRCLRHLNMVHGEEYFYKGGHTNIHTDFAPLSFFFVRFNAQNESVLCGGIIFHGKHDGFGSGSAPTFSVCLTPTNGWSIHT